jgi:UDP-N-acetylmuramoylalanine--D-glutamate ligase
MKIGIIGWGIEGQSAFKYFGPEHDYLIVNEHPRDDFPPSSDKVKVQFLDKDKQVGITGQAQDFSYLEGIADCDRIIYSVTSAKNLEALFPNNDPFWQKALTTQHIFFDNVKSKNIIGVTGSKGKGTTSTLIAKMLEAVGKKVHLGGNIGISVLDLINDIGPEDWVVLELSNFQLYKLNRSPHIGVCLMIVPEHMDWHPDMEDYVRAKSNIFKWQKPDDIAIYLAGNQYCERIVGASAAKKIPFYREPGAHVRDGNTIVIANQEIIKRSDIKLLGEHNLQNICAAVTATWQVHQNAEAIRRVLSSFAGLEHRLEFVRELDGVKYYDDSFGTTPETAIVAMKSFIQPVVIILGGSDKGADFESLVNEVLRSRVKHAIIIGQTGEKISELLRAKGFSNITYGLTTMPEIVAEARKQARAGDVVLLSTASASFDLFQDYKDRGDQFKQAVKALSSAGQ